jgi:histone deacetylase 6
VVGGELDNGFAIIRPPGHHAEPGMAGGFCILNNVAIAADYAVRSLDTKRILIVDYDIHHGNGTEKIFIDNPNVLCISIHSYLRKTFYPFQASGSPRNVGSGFGKGFTVNVGWSRKGMGDEEYAAAWKHVLMPMAREFQPDLVLVAAGFDGAQGDLYDGHVSPQGFANMTKALMALGPVVCSLEGGYVLSVLGECVCAVVKALLNGNMSATSSRCPLTQSPRKIYKRQ